jgi:hypothetical protein
MEGDEEDVVNSAALTKLCDAVTPVTSVRILVSRSQNNSSTTDDTLQRWSDGILLNYATFLCRCLASQGQLISNSGINLFMLICYCMNRQLSL